MHLIKLNDQLLKMPDENTIPPENRFAKIKMVNKAA
jgi:hypothetical protein